jgi:hypothetical protein
MTHAFPSLIPIQRPIRLEVDDAIYAASFGLVMTPRFVVPAAWRMWNGGAIWRLAQATLMDRDWSTLPVLADALEEAGCAEEDLLHHFREVKHQLKHCAALFRLLEGLLGFGCARESAAQ